MCFNGGMPNGYLTQNERTTSGAGAVHFNALCSALSREQRVIWNLVKVCVSIARYRYSVLYELELAENVKLITIKINIFPHVHCF